jgi:hypothetical protein
VRSLEMDHSSQQAIGGMTTPRPAAAAQTTATLEGLVAELRSLAFRGLPRMFDAETGLFVYRLDRRDRDAVPAGLSRRYTAMVLLGLTGEAPEVASTLLRGETIAESATRLVETAGPDDSLGDLALIAWAARAAGCPADSVWKRIAELKPTALPYPTVELAWVVSAAAADPQMAASGFGSELAARLRGAFHRSTGIFGHECGGKATGLRSHVSCFADFVYPAMALAQYGVATGDKDAITVAGDAARVMCRLQGADGQWWWHFDHRTGRVIEEYPVYAVHQDAMAPMALFAVAQAANLNFDEAIARGLKWLQRAPELDGGSLIDQDAGLIWRKIARREPAKLNRYVQAGASYLSPNLRAPGMNTVFPPIAVDFEDRPYHLGWILYAWPSYRAAAWPLTIHNGR